MSFCIQLQQNLESGFNSAVSTLNAATQKVSNSMSSTYSQLCAKINELSDEILGPNIPRLKQERQSINVNAIPRTIQPGKVIPRFYKPVWLSTDQICELKVSKNGRTEGRKWGIYEGKEWGIPEQMRDSCFIFHKVVHTRDANGPYHWLTERVVAMDYAGADGKIWFVPTDIHRDTLNRVVEIAENYGS